MGAVCRNTTPREIRRRSGRDQEKTRRWAPDLERRRGTLEASSDTMLVLQLVLDKGPWAVYIYTQNNIYIKQYISITIYITNYNFIRWKSEGRKPSKQHYSEFKEPSRRID
ncbi:hypothetical protein Droror1_Dr00014973 [Drosera rotundifolia]